MTARPTTNRSAPSSSASRGLATRAWSWVAPPGSRSPGTARTSRPANREVAARSVAAQTMPSQPLSTASPHRSSTCSWLATWSLVSTVIPSTPGTARSAPAAPSASPSTAAFSIVAPPEVWTVTHRAPSEPTTRAARPTVLGMSCNFRSQKTSNPASTNAPTASGPDAV